MTNDAKTHTAGPWIYEPSSSEFGTGPTVESEFGLIVHMPASEDEEGKANARLIAAAPELLAALIDARSMITRMKGEFSSFPHARLAAIEATIAKATGGTP